MTDGLHLEPESEPFHLEGLERRIGKARAKAPDNGSGALAGLALVFSLGLSIVSAVLLGDWVGRWLESRFLAGFLYPLSMAVALVFACWSIYRQIRFVVRLVEKKKV